MALLPGIISQLGLDKLADLRKINEAVSASAGKAGEPAWLRACRTAVHVPIAVLLSAGAAAHTVALSTRRECVRTPT